MTFSTRLARPSTSPPHLSRQHYIGVAAEDEGGKICQAMAGDWQPWPTLVMGSGCTPSQNQREALVAVADQLGNLQRNLSPDQVEGLPVGEVVRTFAMGLIKDRLRVTHLELATQNLLDSRGTVPDWLFELLLAGALLTKLYYQARARGFDAPARPDHSDQVVLKRGSLAFARLEEDYLVPCRTVLESVRKQVDSISSALVPEAGDGARFVNDTFCEFIADVIASLHHEPMTVRLMDVHALAELAWFSLGSVISPRVYPGWGDLLLELSNHDDPKQGRIGRPLFKNMTRAQSLIASRYQEVTRSSWSTRWSSRSPDEGIYSKAATVLQAQYALFSPSRKGGPPYPTAFVTSFDLELELALLACKKPFTIAFPVHVINPRASLAHTCWLALAAKPQGQNDDLKALLQPQVTDISILDANTPVSGPIVTRLAGCPLIEVPKLPRTQLGNALAQLLHSTLESEVPPGLPAEENARYLDDLKSGLTVQHAVVLNEHDAILQSAVDLIPIPRGTGGGSDSMIHFGLPPDFAAGKEKWSRFWMMLGVQIQDSGIRNRIATLISTLPLTAGQKPDRKRERCGVAVNRYLTELEQDLMFWNGFDVVREDVSAFAEDLEHYLKHLEQEKQITRGHCDV